MHHWKMTIQSGKPTEWMHMFFLGFIWWDKSTRIPWRVNWWMGPLSKYHRSCWSFWLEIPSFKPNHGLLQILISQTREWKKSICLAVVSCWHKKGWEMIGKLHRIQNPHESNQRPHDLVHVFLPKLSWRNLAVNRFIFLNTCWQTGSIRVPWRYTSEQPLFWWNWFCYFLCFFLAKNIPPKRFFRLQECWKVPKAASTLTARCPVRKKPSCQNERSPRNIEI